MAARLVEAPEQTEAMRQRLQQCVSGAAWDDSEMRRRLAWKLERELPGLEALVIDDTGFPKKGVHSVGVARQYSGTLGLTENCQVAVSLHVAGEKGSGCIAMPVSWREGSRGEQSSRFAAVRVRTAERHVQRAPPSEEVWLLIERPREETAPTKYSLCSLPANTRLKELVRLAKLRWRVERDYQELKGEVGLDHFEGRGWRGFHHHASLCMVAHGFLALRRALFPPEENALDTARGAPPPSAPAAAPHRPLPTLPAPHQRPRTSSGAVTYATG